MEASTVSQSIGGVLIWGYFLSRIITSMHIHHVVMLVTSVISLLVITIEV